MKLQYQFNAQSPRHRVSFVIFRGRGWEGVPAVGKQWEIENWKWSWGFIVDSNEMGYLEHIKFV